MARDDYSPSFGAAVGSRTGLSHDVLDITLPQVILSDGTVLSAVTLNLAAAKLQRTVSLNTIVYAPAIRRMGQVVFSGGRAPDNADFELENLRGLYGELMLDPERTLDGASLVMHRAANVAARHLPPVFEFDELTRGYIHGVTVTGDAVQFSVVHEMSDPSITVGARELTQRCADLFEGEFCGHVGAPPGATCSHIFDDKVNGCEFWGMQYRYYAVPPLSVRQTQGRVIITGDRGGGFPRDSNPGARPPFYDRDFARPFKPVSPGPGGPRRMLTA